MIRPSASTLSALSTLFHDKGRKVSKIYRKTCEHYEVKDDLHDYVFNPNVKKVMRRVFLSLHPDKVKDFDEKGNERFLLMTTAKDYWEGEVQANRDDPCKLTLIHQMLTDLTKPPAPKPAPKPPTPKKRPAPATEKDTPAPPPKKRNKTGRSTHPETNFFHYRQVWIQETAQQKHHDLTEADCEVILDTFLGYVGWDKPSFLKALDGGEYRHVLPMKTFWKVTKVAETRINNLAKQRTGLLGLRTDGRHIKWIVMAD
jgi:hypothetical protein